MKVYLASPFFNDEENKYYEKMIKMLRDEGHKVFVPKEHEIPNAWDLPNAVWGENVFAVDVLGIQKCDVVVVLNHGMYSDSGTAWECGYAYALGKDVVNVLCGEGNYSLMMLNGCNTYVKFDDFSRWFLEHLVQGKNIKPDIEQK
jgi:nucleoside 2-deoxyribosyltransferase